MISLSKRFVFVLLLALAIQLPAQFANPLYIPDTLSGTTFDLTMAPSKVSFLPGDSTDTYGINADYLGKVLFLNKGDFVTLNVTNDINDTITMHWHGLHVAPEDDGGPHTLILPGETWSPDFEVLDEAATFWYHPHMHTKTAEQVYKGAAGMLIVRDQNEASLNLPRTYGVDDFPMIIQDKSFDASNQFVFAAMSDSMMLNGTLAPYLEVPAQMVRFRLLNASNQRVYNIGFPFFLNFWQIGTDGGLLERPISGPRIQLSPGERAEIVVDFSQAPVGSNQIMKAFNSEMGPGVSGSPTGPGGGPGNPLDGNDFDFLQFRVVAPTANPITSLPMNMNTFDIPAEVDADVFRTKVFDADTSGFPYLINSTPYHHHHVNDTVLLDDIEVWELINVTDVAHPFHIHDVQFYVLEINGAPAPPTLAGRKDVILSNVGDTIRFITKFDDFTDEHIPYMYHCHNLFHEDAGMMAHFIVVDSTFLAAEGALGTDDLSGQYTLFPNPAAAQVTIRAKDATKSRMKSLELYDMLGRKLDSYLLGAGKSEHQIALEGLDAGMYLVKITDQKGNTGMIRFLHK